MKVKRLRDAGIDFRKSRRGIVIILNTAVVFALCGGLTMVLIFRPEILGFFK